MSRSTPELVAAGYALHLTTADELVGFAKEALWNDLSSPSLDLLALLQSAELRDADGLFVAALEELGIPIPSRAEAVRRLAREISTEMVRGETTPYDGTAEIAELCRLVSDVDFPELHTFIYADSEWFCRPEDENILVEGVMLAAQEVANPD